ncbi:MAG: hypothetical protein OXE41_06065 [Gammaproteobacteria bacterium]|nr:hypothetical protein [Gammaproteobacteria bacterium]MCY4274944.1 hypothetical protein [Gammaproteobacteria bacterium]
MEFPRSNKIYSTPFIDLLTQASVTTPNSKGHKHTLKILLYIESEQIQISTGRWRQRIKAHGALGTDDPVAQDSLP